MHKISKTEVLNQSPKSIKRAADYLNNDELVSFPTETVYGLGASAISNIAVAKIFSTKGRPKYNPLIIHIAEAVDALKWALVPERAEILINNFWPGPLTLVLMKKDVNTQLASLVTGNLKTVAIRVPMHPTARSLIKEFGFPIAAPSANLSGKISPTRSKDVLTNLDGKIAALIEGEQCFVGLESTIIGFNNEQPILLRPGGIPTEIIEEKIGMSLRRHKEPTSNKNTIIAPGMMNSHYAPNCELKLNVKSPGPGELFLGFGDMPKNTVGLCLSQKGSLTEAAANLFSSLMDIDLMAELMKISTVSVAPIPNFGLGGAINDRLRRAAAPRI
jgi:L-threonylcarbamoyladenylate synthase